MNTQEILGAEKPIVGMVHLPALPGAPGYEAKYGRDRIRAAAERDAQRLAEGGVDAVMVENFGDAPFYPEDVPKHVVADMTDAVKTVRETVDCPVGVNVLRNDAVAALSVAAAADASFVRVNVHVGGRVTDQGVLEGSAHETLRHRARIDAAGVKILADVAVKHSRPLGKPQPLGEAVAENVERGLADGIIVSGAQTGTPAERGALERAVEAREDLGLDAPVLVGSGVSVDNVSDLLSVADGAIVGTAFKRGGETVNPVERDQVADLVTAAEAAR